MLDVSFWELIMIGLVALLVFGPERLPELARTLGRWVGRAKAYVNSVKSDIDREVRLQELQDMLRQSERKDLYEFIAEKPSSGGPAQPPAAALGDTSAEAPPPAEKTDSKPQS